MNEIESRLASNAALARTTVEPEEDTCSPRSHHANEST